MFGFLAALSVADRIMAETSQIIAFFIFRLNIPQNNFFSQLGNSHKLNISHTLKSLLGRPLIPIATSCLPLRSAIYLPLLFLLILFGFPLDEPVFHTNLRLSLQLSAYPITTPVR